MPFEVNPISPLTEAEMRKKPEEVAEDIKRIYEKAEELGGRVIAQHELTTEGENAFGTVSRHILYLVSELPADTSS